MIDRLMSHFNTPAACLRSLERFSNTSAVICIASYADIAIQGQAAPQIAVFGAAFGLAGALFSQEPIRDMRAALAETTPVQTPSP